MERILLCTSGMEIWPLEAVNTENIKNYFDLLHDVLEKKKKRFVDHPEAIEKAYKEVLSLGGRKLN